ncbi:MAG: cell envelope biogenesis protein LolA [Bacteroidaceae bacterium]|nr:cell envelope biogenesis protein LolA [Bacteroidaceae bacterium]MCF0243776.1 cell envelope biogenesis protein LolA [Bacteroidaceae bacterium]
MKKTIFLLFVSLISVTMAAQTAKETMDKAVAALTKSSVMVNYACSGQMTESGTLALKGNKFCARSKSATVWNDGKTQWTYVKSTDEVNVIQASSKKISAVNPYAILNLYKSGYTLTQKKVAAGTEIYMKSTEKKTYSEVYVTLNANLQPVQIRFKNSKGWTTVNFSNYQTKKLSSSTFKFNKKEFPTAEINDLR